MNNENIVSDIVTVAPSTSATPIVRRRRRANGKVARLPVEARNLVNHALRDGARYNDVVSQLAARGYRGFSRSHIMSWASSGYLPWLADQERFEASRKLSLRAMALLGRVREGGRCELADLNNWLMAAQLTELLESVDQEAIKRLLAEKPAEYFRLARILTTQAAALSQHRAVELQRLKYELEIRKIEDQESGRNRPRCLTAATIAQIEAAAKML